ncbi:MAG: ABC transporter permease subunit [Anaerolineales bacterium]|nr:ABC transporter permease subunit [Anaerolineales bacterium]
MRPNATDPTLLQPGRWSFWRDSRFLQALAQAIFVVLVLIAGRWLVGNLFTSLEERGLDLNFQFLQRTAGFGIGEGLPFERTDSFWRAFVVGFVNSIRVIVFGLALATVLGILAGISLLSGNWLLRNLVSAYVEVMRNTPLLVQLFFIYFGIILKLPSLQERLIVGQFSLSNRGFYFPRAVPQDGATLWLVLAGAALVGGIILYRILLKKRILTGSEAWPGLKAGLLIFGIPLISWFLIPGNPFTLEYPELVGLRMEGGARVTPEFAGILFGLVLYTGAFIADIVRAGILAVPKGQLEAAKASGLTQAQVLRLVILPQAMRVIIPPLTNQYLNLAKNSSLAVGVGFPDLYNISSTIFNQSGQAVQVISLMMITYLLMSLLISAVMNVLNERLKIPER